MVLDTILRRKLVEEGADTTPGPEAPHLTFSKQLLFPCKNRSYTLYF